MRLEVLIHHDGAEYWSEIAELPGCFASGRTLTELHEALAEAIGLYLWDGCAQLKPEILTVGAMEVEAEQPVKP